MDYESFYESLKYHLQKKGHGGQALVCRQTDIPRSYLSRIMKKGRRAGVKTQRKIARFFGYGLEEFVEVGKRITLGENPEASVELFKKMPEEQLMERLIDAVRKEMSTAKLLNQTQLLYEDIVENSRQMIVRFDEHLHISFVNRGFEHMVGRDRLLLISQSWKSLVDEKYHEELLGKIDELKGTGGSFPMEIFGGLSKRWFYLTVTVFPPGFSGKDRMQWVGFDVTDGVAIRRRLEESERELQRVVDRLRFIQHGVEMSYVPTLWIGERANIIYVNKAACALLGYSLQELENMHVWDINPLIPKEDWPKKWAWFEAEENVIFSGQYKTKDGAIIPVEFHVSNLKYPDGRRYNVVFVTPMVEKK
jgi:PAS domain S-box-containing protein